MHTKFAWKDELFTETDLHKKSFTDGWPNYDTSQFQVVPSILVEQTFFLQIEARSTNVVRAIAFFSIRSD